MGLILSGLGYYPGQKVSGKSDFPQFFELDYQNSFKKFTYPMGGFFFSKGTWGCAARKDILFQTF